MVYMALSCQDMFRSLLLLFHQKEKEKGGGAIKGNISLQRKRNRTLSCSQGSLLILSSL